MSDQEKLEANQKKFTEEFEKRFDSNMTTCCEYHECPTRLSPNQVQIFTMPNMEIKVFCIEHLLATLFRLDPKTFEQVLNLSYKPPLRGATRVFIQDKYGRQN